MSEKPAYNIQVEFINEQSGSTVQLTYELFDNSFSNRWLKLFKRAVDKNYGVQHDGIFYGTALNKEEDCVQQMTDTVKGLNEFTAKQKSQEQHIELVPHMGMSQEFLNDMHKRFENMRPDPNYQQKDVQELLADLNTLVHRCEGFLNDGFQGCHVEINFNKVEYGDLEPGDLELFTPDKTFGNLYLTYGVTGVPVEAAFYARPKDPPLPQPNYCSGCFLYFNDTYQFQQWDEMEQWLKESYGWDINDPKLAIGYIPLGKLITPYKSREAVVEMIAGHQKINKITLLPRSLEPQKPEEEDQGFIDNILSKLGLKKKRPIPA